MTIRTPNTFIVGAGPVATALAGALRLGGVPVLGLWSRNPQAVREAAAISGVASYSSAPPDILLECEVIVVAVRDQAIGEVAQTLIRTGLINKRHIMLHCSGALSAAEAFGEVRDAIGGSGTLHPLRAIADGRATMRGLADTVFGVEGDERGEAAARNLVTAMGGRLLPLSSEQMAVYHAAAAIASNYTVTLVDAAVNLLGRVGISESDAVAALLPLIRGSLDNIEQKGVVHGLTGPIRRGDLETISRHLATLPASSDNDVAEIYRVLGQATVRLTRRSEEVDPGTLDEMAKMLDKGSPKRSSSGQSSSVSARASSGESTGSS